MARDTTSALVPAPPQLRGLAKAYGIAGVFFNHSLSGTLTMGRLIGIRDSPPVIELRPGLDEGTRLFILFHEAGHHVRNETRAEDVDRRLTLSALRRYRSYRAAGHPPLSDFEDLHAEEERIVNSWAFNELMRHFGPRYGREEEYEARGFIFEHRDP